MHQRRICVHGDALSVFMVWEKLLQQLHGVDALDAQGDMPDLLRAGDQFANHVSVLLKTVDEKDGKVILANRLHQA